MKGTRELSLYRIAPIEKEPTFVLRSEDPSIRQARNELMIDEINRDYFRELLRGGKEKLVLGAIVMGGTALPLSDLVTAHDGQATAVGIGITGMAAGALLLVNGVIDLVRSYRIWREVEEKRTSFFVKFKAGQPGCD